MMWHTTWLKQGSARTRRSRGYRVGAARPPSFVPRLLALEDRTLPSTITVTNNADDGPGSLRTAITDAQSGDQIVFDPSLNGQTITLTSGQLAITKSLDIEGPGADLLAVSGNHARRIFDISGGVTVTIAGLTITDGRAAGAPGAGGRIQNIGSNWTLVTDTFSNTEALGVGATRGAGPLTAGRAPLSPLRTACSSITWPPAAKPLPGPSTVPGPPPSPTASSSA